MKDLASNIDVKRVISPVSVADNSAQVGQIIDRRGFDSVTFLIATSLILNSINYFPWKFRKKNYLAMKASISSTVVGKSANMSNTSPSVTTTLFSIRIPMFSSGI